MARNTFSPEQDFSDWSMSRLQEYHDDLSCSKNWRDRLIKRKVSSILSQRYRDTEKQIVSIVQNTFLDQDGNYSFLDGNRLDIAYFILFIWITLEKFGYKKQQDKWGLWNSLFPKYIYKSENKIVEIDIESWKMRILNLVEPMNGMYTEEKKKKIKEKYPDLGTKHILYTSLWDLYTNHIAEVLHTDIDIFDIREDTVNINWLIQWLVQVKLLN